MRTTGRLVDACKTLKGKFRLTFEVDDDVSNFVNKELSKKATNTEATKLSLEVKPHRKSRSLSANALLWSLISIIADHVGDDKWSIYLKLIRRYGRYTYIVCKPEAVEAMQAQWRETEIVGDITVNGQPAVQMLVYFGSSTYDTAEFSRLLEGTISELQEMGLQNPYCSADMQRALEEWETTHG